MDQIQPYLDYFAQHPDWALIIIFLIAFGEALLVIGLFVPSTAVLVGAGTLVGAGKLHFWPVIAATILGCILGDQVSYWAGRIYGDRLKTIWPLSRYPHLMAKGEEFFKKNGGKSIALGRFVPGVKAVVPGIAGMFGMNQAFFLTVNVASGIVWAFAHVLPGVALGQALSLAGELSGRLLFVLLVLLVTLAVAGWLIRLIAASITPYRKAIQGRIANRARKSQNRFVQRFGRAIAPENPSSMLLVLLIICFILALVALADIVSGLVLRHAVGSLDLTLNNLFSELRSPPGDELMERITMMGDEVVMWGTAAAMIIWLAAQKAWRQAIAVLVAVMCGQLILLATSFTFTAPTNLTNPEAFYFPSGHALMAGVVFGVLAVLCSHSMARWTQAIVVAVASLIVIAISFTRLYLGVNWLSDVLGGVLVALIIATLFGVAITTFSNLKIRPLGLIGVTFAAFLTMGGLHINANYLANEALYLPQDKIQTFALADWANTGFSKLPPRRIDIAGKTKEVFVMQWIGSIDSLNAALLPLHYQVLPQWTLRDSIAYLDPKAPLETLAPRPATHDGLKAKLTAVLPIQDNVPARITLRAFESNVVAKGATDERVYLVSLTHETLRSQFNMFAMPMGAQVSVPEASAFIAGMKSEIAVEVLGEKQIGGLPVIILKPKQ
jgi:membrane protein DedA with SNARE-associated domain/membrane-associated phospholipid phosphatase